MGLACDHLLGVEMVVPSGKHGAQVIQADEHNNADLLWASRGGGGGNFGIATSFTLDIRPLSTVTIYEATWDWQHLSELLSVWQDLAPSADDRLGSVLSRLPRQAGTITSYGMFIGSEEAPAARSAPTPAWDREARSYDRSHDLSRCLQALRLPARSTEKGQVFLGLAL
jgi:FAD/FMN-containing dehydrogenase